MSKTTQHTDDLLPEYDFPSIAGGVRGKYYRRYREGVNLVLLDPDLARAFPTDAAVNDALRKVLRAAKASRRGTTRPTNREQRTRSAKAKRPGRR